MSTQATTWVLEFSEARGADRLVMIAIAHRVSNDDGQAFPSVARIAREANLSERAVHYSIEALVKSGELEVQLNASKYGTNIYRLPKFNLWVQTLHPPGCKVREKRVQTTTQTPAQIAPESSEENQKINLPPSADPIPFPSEDKLQNLNQLLEDYYRRRWKTDETGRRYLIAPASPHRRIYESEMLK